MILQRWFGKTSSVLDPFCGGGTALLEATLDGRGSIGVDLSPLAVALSRAKLQSVTQDLALQRLNELARGFEAYDEPDVPDEARIIFHPRTLSQICYLREALGDTPEDVFLKGTTLGILHGKGRRDGSTQYLSVDMPNTFSMSPNYVLSFIKTHQLTLKPVDTFAALRRRVRWLLRAGPAARAPSTVVEGDATQLHSIVPKLLRGRFVGGILTSPPYLGVLRYGAFNWIRLWFLGADARAVDRRLDNTDSLHRYLSFLVTFLLSAAEVLRAGSPLALVVGDVDECGQHLPLAERVWEEVCGVVPFTLQEVVVDSFDDSGKTTRIWGEQRKGKATKRDRILVLRRLLRG